MFEQSDESVDRVRSRIIMVLAGVAVAVLLGALLLFGRFQDTPPEAPPPPPQLENALRAGDPEFEKYTKQVVLLNTEFFTQSNMLGQRQAVIRGQIANFTERTVTGVELRGTVVGENGVVMATTLALPVPRKFDQIGPKGSVPFAVTVDGVPAKGTIEDITINLVGLSFAP